MKPLGIARSFDDFEPELLLGRRAFGLKSIVAIIGEDQLQPRESPFDLVDDQCETVAILDACAVDLYNQWQPEGITEDMTLTSGNCRASTLLTDTDNHVGRC